MKLFRSIGGPISGAAILSLVAALFSLTAHAQQLDEIIVTAQKRSESLQDVPITINAISDEELSESGVDDLFEIANIVPGMIFGRAGDDGLLLTLRGLGSPARSPVFEQSIAFFSDGLFYGKGRYYSVPFFDVERIEFIKGTQSTLLGKNASIGAISQISRRPGDEFGGNIKFEGEVESLGGHTDGYTFEGAVDLPVSDQFKLRLSTHITDVDGWLNNLTLDEALPRDESQAFRAIAEYSPSEDVTATLIYQKSNTERFGANAQTVNSPDPRLQIDNIFDENVTQFIGRTGTHTSENDTDLQLVNFILDIGVLNGHTLVSQTTYSDYTVDFFDDFDMSLLDEVLLIKDEEYDQITQEFRLQSPTGNELEYMAGLFYMDSTWHMIETLDMSIPGVFIPPGQLFNGPFSSDFEQDTRTVSIFASGTYHISDRLRISGGLRYTDEKKDIIFSRFASAPFTFWNTIANPPFGPVPLEFDDTFLDGNLNIQYDLSEDIMVFAAYGRGTKTGGYVDTNAVPTGNPAVESFIDSETTDTYELGIKSQLLDNRLQLNATLFFVDVTDLQETTFNGGFVTSNLPAESKGIDFDIKFLVTGNLTVTANGHALDSEVIIDGTEFRPPQSPQFSGNLGLSYEGSLTADKFWRFSATARNRSKIYHQRGNLFPSDGVTTYDATISVGDKNGKWDASLIARNLSNEFILDFASPNPHPFNGDVYSLGHLRTIKLAVKYNF